MLAYLPASPHLRIPLSLPGVLGLATPEGTLFPLSSGATVPLPYCHLTLWSASPKHLKRVAANWLLLHPSS